MLPKANRLLKKEDFQKAWKGGGSFYTKNLGFKLRKTTNTTLKLGVVVSNKISKLATVRNKIKRRIRVLIAKKLLQFKKNADLVLIVIPGLETKDILETEKMITKLLQRANIINYV